MGEVPGEAGRLILAVITVIGVWVLVYPVAQLIVDAVFGGSGR